MASAKNPFCITALILRMQDGMSLLKGLRQDSHGHGSAMSHRLDRRFR